MHDKTTLNTKQVTLVTHCRPTTLRSWRLRNGLFPHLPCDGSHTKYNIADAIGVRLMVELTRSGLNAQFAADLLNTLRLLLNSAATGGKLRVGICQAATTDSLELKDISTLDSNDSLSQLPGPILLVIDLASIFSDVWHALNEERPS